MKTPKVYKGEEAAATAAATPTSADQADAAKGSSVTTASPVATDTPPEQKPAGTISTDAPPSEDQGGAGNAAGPAGFPFVEEAKEAISTAKDKFAKAFPHFAAAMEAWAVKSPNVAPVALRIVSRRDGFRRAGIAHTKEAVDHPLDAFTAPEPLEQLFAEPNLVVQLV